MKITWSRLALDRVMEVVEYIAEDNREAAEAWAEGLFRAVRKLARFPRLGRLVPELRREDFREISYGDYRVVYRTRGKSVEILTVRHGRRLLDETELGG